MSPVVVQSKSAAEGVSAAGKWAGLRSGRGKFHNLSRPDRFGLAARHLAADGQCGQTQIDQRHGEVRAAITFQAERLDLFDRPALGQSFHERAIVGDVDPEPGRKMRH